MPKGIFTFFLICEHLLMFHSRLLRNNFTLNKYRLYLQVFELSLDFHFQKYFFIKLNHVMFSYILHKSMHIYLIIHLLKHLLIFLYLNRQILSSAVLPLYNLFFYSPLSNVQRSQFSHIKLVDLFVSILVILMHVRQYLFVVLRCYSNALAYSGLEHVLICLSVICTCPLEKCQSLLPIFFSFFKLMYS